MQQDVQSSSSGKLVIDVMQQRRITLTSLEGSIGAGKSSLLDAMREVIARAGLLAITAENRCVSASRHRFLLIPEPIESWTKQVYNVARPSEPAERMAILKYFYAAMRKRGFLFQVKAFTSREQLLCEQLGRLAREHTEQDCVIHVIMERSLATDRIFFRNLFESQDPECQVREIEWDVYNEFFALVTRDTQRHHDTMVYINTGPLRCKERIVKRGREGEEHIPMQYLEELRGQHERMVEDFRGAPGCRVYDIDFQHDMTQGDIEQVAHTLVYALLQQRCDEDDVKVM